MGQTPRIWDRGCLDSGVSYLGQRGRQDAGPAGSGADVADRREQGVLPEVVGLPLGDLISRSGSVPRWSAAAASTATLAQVPAARSTTQWGGTCGSSTACPGPSPVPATPPAASWGL